MARPTFSAQSSAARRCMSAALALSSLALTDCASSADAQDAFSKRELSALEAGELVSRPRHVRRDNLDLIGGSSWQRIDAPLEVVWRAIHDVARYSELLPAVVVSRIVERHDDSRLVFIKHRTWPFEGSYYTWQRSDAARYTLDFKLEPSRPSSLAAGWGSVQLTARGSQQTILAFSGLVDVGQGVLAKIAQSIIQPTMLSTPTTVKGFVEGGGAELYRSDARDPPR